MISSNFYLMFCQGCLYSTELIIEILFRPQNIKPKWSSIFHFIYFSKSDREFHEDTHRYNSCKKMFNFTLEFFKTVRFGPTVEISEVYDTFVAVRFIYYFLVFLSIYFFLSSSIILSGALCCCDNLNEYDTSSSRIILT